MNILIKFFKKLYHDMRGGSSFEYAILAALIACGVIGALTIIGIAVMRLFEFEFPSPF